jgi:hypothetical protein
VGIAADDDHDIHDNPDKHDEHDNTTEEHGERPIDRAQPPTIGIVVTGDNHLSAYLPRLTPLRRAERRQRLRAGFAAAVTYAIEHGARLFIQAGDLFDTPTPSNQDRAFVAEALARLRRAGIASIGIGGNHDTPRMTTEQGGEAPQRTYAALDGLCYFPRHDALAPRLFTFDGLNIAVAGLSNHPVAAPGSDPLATAQIADPEGILAQADIAMLVLHAGIEGLCQPNEGDRLVMRASIAALPDIFHVIVAGHIHRFGRARIGEREVVVCGATERMEFDSAGGNSCFAWIELGKDGVQRVEQVRVPEQPRADLIISTAQLWPVNGQHATPTLPAPPAARLPDALELPDADVAGVSDSADIIPEMSDVTGPLWRAAKPRLSGPLDVIRRRLAEVATPETMVRLRLTGPLTVEQYHQLVTREILADGQRRCFSFELDTSGLSLTDGLAARVGLVARAGPISPVHEAETVLEERLAGVADGDATQASDERAAAALLIERLRAATEREAGQ